MDNVREIFNILLLSISLATVFITLVSFIIFKFRYTLGKNEKAALHHLQGSFFKRYAPKLQLENEKILSANWEKKKLRTPPQKKILWAFISFTLFLFVLLSAENYLSYRKNNRQAQMDLKRIKTLIENGMLRTYDFDPREKSQAFKEEISPNLKSYKENLIISLNSQKLVLIRDGRNNSRNAPTFPQAFEGWHNFFKKNEINFKVKGISQIQKDDIVILPQVKYLSREQRKKLLALKGKASFIFTGYTGTYDSNGNEGQSIITELVNLRFEVNKNTDNFYPLQYFNRYGLPAGKLVEWYALDNNLTVVKDLTLQSRSLARYSLYEGESPNAVMADYSFPQDKVSWTALDPNEKMGFYEELYLLSLIQESYQNSFIEVATWKKAKNKGFVGLTVDVEDKFSNIEKFWTLFSKEKVNASFYLVSELMLENSNLPFDANLSFEYGSHTKDHKVLSLRDPKTLFEDLQESRLEIEEKILKPVLGFRPPLEVIEESAITSILQNKFDYIFAQNIDNRFSPYFVNGGQTVYFPRTLSDDYEYFKNFIIKNKEALLKDLRNDFNWVISSGGAYLQSMHTQLITEQVSWEAYKEFIHEFPKSGLWIGTLGELSTWWKKKANLVIQKKDGQYYLTNLGAESVRNFDLVIHFPQELYSLCAEKSPLEEEMFEDLVLHIDGIQGKASVVVCTYL